MVVVLAWSTRGDGVLRPVEVDAPEPSPGEVLVAVEACGVCRTDLHVVRGELPARRPAVVPGHEVVGRVVAAEGDVGGLRPWARVGVPWLRSTCGACRWCRAGRENLCEAATHTGWDADGGFAEQLVAPAAWCYALPDDADPVQTAPLLCAGIIGYRALRRAEVPPGGRLGLYGFGASAHLVAQLALAQGAEVHVVTRGGAARQLALELGAASAVDLDGAVPPLDAAVLFAPVGELARTALAALAPGGTLAMAGIWSTDVPPLRYAEHLFRERTVTTVTANTREDGRELLLLAQRLGVRPRVRAYVLEQAVEALDDLDAGEASGVAVLDVRAG